MTEFERLARECWRWSSRQFGGHRNPTGSIAHLEKEVAELGEANLCYREGCQDSRGRFVDRRALLVELADCQMLLLDAMTRIGFEPQDLIDATFDKLDVNRYRKWSDPGPDGVVEHVREDSQ